MCTKQVVSWQVRVDIAETLVTMTLQRALLAQQPAPGLLVYSDQSEQYVGNVYRTLLRVSKRSRRGEYHDNAQAESHWSHLKTELLEVRDWPIFTELADAQVSVAN